MRSTPNKDIIEKKGATQIPITERASRTPHFTTIEKAFDFLAQDRAKFQHYSRFPENPSKKFLSFTPQNIEFQINFEKTRVRSCTLSDFLMITQKIKTLQQIQV